MEKMLYFIIFAPIISSIIIYLINNKKIHYIFILTQLSLLLPIVLVFRYTIYYDKIGIVLGKIDSNISIVLNLGFFQSSILIMSYMMFSIIAFYSLSNRRYDNKYMFFFLLIEGAFYAHILSDDLYNILIIIDTITIISTVLIMYQKDRFSLQSGIYYILFNSIGMVLFLLGIIIIYYDFNTLNISLIVQKAKMGTEYSKLGFSFIFTAMAIKSALFPVYDWLPRAHASAPSEISALLSGFLVKSGIIVIMKLILPIQSDSIRNILIFFGIISAISGAIFSLAQKNIKSILSYHTISQLGIILAGMAVDIKSGLLYLLVHSIFKTVLFLLSDKMIEVYGTNNIKKMKGMWKISKPFSIAIIINAFNIMSLPLTSGYIAKEFTKKSIDIPYITVYFILISLGSSLSFSKWIFTLFGNSNKKIEFDVYQKISLILGTGIVFLTGIWLKPYELFGVNFYKLYNLKSIIMATSIVLVAMILYPLFFKKTKLLEPLRKFHIEFRDGIVLMLVFFLVIYYFY